MPQRFLFLALIALLAGCGDDDGARDGGRVDSGDEDAGEDAGSDDAGPEDGGTDAGPGDGGPIDAGPECERTADCPSPPERCNMGFCGGMMCMVAPVAEGTPIGAQTDGDCLQHQCDGA